MIVSDGSTDGTGSILPKYTGQHDWIEFVRLPARDHPAILQAKFSLSMKAMLACTDSGYDAIGSLDADISFDREYFAFLLARISEDPALGLVGTPFEEEGTTYDYRFVSIEHVSGACQLFRRNALRRWGALFQCPAEASIMSPSLQPG